MIIASHSNLVPPDLLIVIRAEAGHFPSVQLIERGGGVAFAFAGDKPTRTVSNPLSDIASRIALIDEQGIDRQVVGGWGEMPGYDLTADEAKRGRDFSMRRCSALKEPEQPQSVQNATLFQSSSCQRRRHKLRAWAAMAHTLSVLSLGSLRTMAKRNRMRK